MPFTEAVVCCCHGARCELAQGDGYEVVPGSMFCPEKKTQSGRGKSKKEQSKNRARDPKASRREEKKKDVGYESVLSYTETAQTESMKKGRTKRKYTMKNVNDIGRAVDLYLGAMASHKAEMETRKKSTFKLYHKIPRSNGLVKLDSVLQLSICYRTSRGSYRHFPIHSRPRFDGKILYSVEHNCPEEASILFDSIEKLTRYYQAYPLIDLKPNGEACIELFPV